MACSLLSVVGIYVAWAAIVLQPLESRILVRWPATLLAACVVFYQAIIWCLCGFRLTRIISLSLVATTLVGIGFVPTLNPPTNFWASERRLSAILVALMVCRLYRDACDCRYSTARRRSWLDRHSSAGSTVCSGAIPRRRTAFKSADAALFWMEWRRSGLVLPAAVTVIMTLILGPVLSFTGRERKGNAVGRDVAGHRMPILLAFPIGLGFGKPDFWSLDLTLSPFFATRPVTAGQLLAAKMKSAACSALLAWAILCWSLPFASICTATRSIGTTFGVNRGCFIRRSRIGCCPYLRSCRRDADYVEPACSQHLAGILRPPRFLLLADRASA